MRCSLCFISEEGSRNTRWQFVKAFERLKLPLHLLFCNAGQMLSPFRYHTTASGYEQQFSANHLGHFHLVNQLLEHMKSCSSGAPPCVG
jgi:NAD(P)-dependent dehydrogenase (short-subunit alcohol dehydrogenase family)